MDSRHRSPSLLVPPTKDNLPEVFYTLKREKGMNDGGRREEREEKTWVRPRGLACANPRPLLSIYRPLQVT